MGDKICFLFGHATVPAGIGNLIEAAARKHYLEYDIRIFVVGHRGQFDQAAASAIKRLKLQYPDITLLLLLAYHPAESPMILPEGFDHSYYPPLEGVPKPFSILQANRYMVTVSDSIICYANHPGNARNLYDYAIRRKKISPLPIENLGVVAETRSCS